jgi:hypothetical protein
MGTEHQTKMAAMSTGVFLQKPAIIKGVNQQLELCKSLSPRPTLYINKNHHSLTQPPCFSSVDKSGPCHQGMARPQVANGGTASGYGG